MAKHRILIVDDDGAIRFGMREFLETQGYVVGEAETCRAAEEAFSNSRPDAVVIDYVLPDGNALDLLARLKELDATVPLLILTGHGSIELAVRALKEGAEHFLTKPVELPTLDVILKRLLENQRVRQKHLANKTRESRATVDPFIGESAAIRELKEQAHRVLATDSPILIQGDTGTGKGVLAAWLHRNGRRADEAFVDLNCAGLSREFLETELFGHGKGAFTGAAASKMGLLEVAHRGTVFLDEIGDVDPLVQPKLLKVMEDKRFRRLGDVRDRYVDVVLIAATHQELSQLVRDKQFRSDLYFRISTIPLRVPALRERQEDIPLLTRELLRRCAGEQKHGDTALAPDAEAALVRYSWPGNIRELRNVLERAILLSDHQTITARDLRFGDIATPAADTARLTLLAVERAHIERVLKDEGWRIEQAARRLGIPRSTLYEKIKKHGFTPSRS